MAESTKLSQDPFGRIQLKRNQIENGTLQSDGSPRESSPVGSSPCHPLLHRPCMRKTLHSKVVVLNFRVPYCFHWEKALTRQWCPSMGQDERTARTTWV